MCYTLPVPQNHLILPQQTFYCEAAYRVECMCLMEHEPLMNCEQELVLWLGWNNQDVICVAHAVEHL